MNNKESKIYTNKIENLKNNIQKEYRCLRCEEKKESLNKISKGDLIYKLKHIFSKPNFIYQADINIMYNNGKTITEKIVGMKDNYLMTFDGKRIYLDEINDIK